MHNNLAEKFKKVSREYRYLPGTGTVIKSTVVVPRGAVSTAHPYLV
jgi:hypothetical protein